VNDRKWPVADRRDRLLLILPTIDGHLAKGILAPMEVFHEAQGAVDQPFFSVKGRRYTRALPYVGSSSFRIAGARALFPRRILDRQERLERDALHDEANAAVGALGNDARETVLIGDQLAEFAFEAQILYAVERDVVG
jgi:hypothetical protein